MPDEKVQSALEVLMDRVVRSEAATADLKRAVNALASSEGMQPIYQEVSEPSRVGVSVRPDEFANQTTPSSAARAFLKLRGHAATVDDIYDAITRGGFGCSKDVKDTKAAIRIALGKDPSMKRLPNGSYGLLEWYPALKREREAEEEQAEEEARKAKREERKAAKEIDKS